MGIAITITSLVVAVAVALAVIYCDVIHDWIFKARLEIAFNFEEPISRENILINGKKGFWPSWRAFSTTAISCATWMMCLCAWGWGRVGVGDREVP